MDVRDSSLDDLFHSTKKLFFRSSVDDYVVEINLTDVHHKSVKDFRRHELLEVSGRALQTHR